MAATTWGDPTSNKRVLLIHGGATSSQGWNPIAQDFASRGYFVTAPDLLGHGLARRGSVYTIAALAEELWPFLKTHRGNDHPYDIVIGHSLGGVVVPALLPLLKSTRPVRVVLGDPPLEETPELPMAFIISGIVNVLKNPESPESIAEKNHITKEDALFVSLGRQLCDIDALQAIGDQNVPWSFSHYLEKVPDNVKVTVLAADPAKGPSVFKEVWVKGYPRVTTRTVLGASHWMQFERPEVFVEAALE